MDFLSPPAHSFRSSHRKDPVLGPYPYRGRATLIRYTPMVILQ